MLGLQDCPGAKGPMGYRGVNGVTGKNWSLWSPQDLRVMQDGVGYLEMLVLLGLLDHPRCVCNNLILYLDRYGFLVDPVDITEENDGF